MQEKLVLEVEVQNQQANAAFDRFETQMNDLRRETLSYRTALQSMNAELADNRKALLNADAAAKEQLETRNRQIRAEQGLIRARQQAASVNLATLQQERREFTKSTTETSKLTGAFGKLAAASGIVYGAMQFGRLADRAFRLGDQLRGVHRGLETVYGSAERAASRFSELNELAKLPGLDPQPLARYDAIFKNLGSTAEQNDILFTGLAKAITTFGGDVHGVNSALLQMSQAFGKNKIDAQDWKSINEQTGGSVMKVAEEVLGFTGGIEGMRKAFKESGMTLQDFLMPVFAELNNRFQGAPVESYTNRIDNLTVAFTNFVGSIAEGETVGNVLGAITGYFEDLTEKYTGGTPLKAIGDEAKVSAAEIVVLQKDLGRVSAELDTTTEKFQRLKNEGVNENTASMQQLSRRIELLEGQSEKLTGRLDTAKNAMQEMLKPTENINTEFRVLKTETETVDTRFMGLRERGVALKDTIAELPPELTRINELLPNTSVHADKLSEYFDTLKVSAVDLKAEQKALNLIYTEGISELNDYAPALNLVVGESNNVDPAIRRMATAARDMNVETKVMQDELRANLVPTLSDVYASLDRTANEAMADLINNAGSAGTELDRLDGYLGNVYENLDRITNETDVPGVLFDISGAISNDLQYALRSMVSGGDFEVTLQDLGGNMGRSFVDGLINEWANEAVQPRINDAFGRLFSTLESSGTITGAASLAGPVAVFAGAVAAFATAGEAWVDHFGGETRQEPIDDWMRLIAGASGLTLPGLQTNFGEWTGGTLDFSGLLTSMTAPTDEGAAALASRRYNLYQQLKSRTGATPQSEADRIAYESGMMSPEESAAYLAGYPEPTPSTTTPSSIGEGSAQVDTERIGDVHRFSGAESGQLKTLEGTLKEKRTDFTSLEGADFSVILDKYGEYTQAILDVYNAKMAFAQNADGIDGQAKETAMTLALQEFHALTYRANRDLESVMGASNLRLVNEFGATTGIIQRGQVIKGIVVPESNRSMRRASSEPRMQTTTFTPAAERAETHRFTSAQSGEIRNIEGRAKQASTDFRDLRTQDFSEILTAYGNYTGMLQDLYDKRVGFINSAHITEDAKETALEAALIAFQNDTFSANQTLARVMGHADLRLVNEFDSTTGIIPRGQVIKRLVSPEGSRGTTSRASSGPRMQTTTFTPATARAETHRFTSAQSGEIRNIEGRAKQARETLRNSGGEDFATIVGAYDTYIGLIQDVYNTRVAFINSARLTEGAKKTALDAALIAFQGDTYAANQLLARVLSESDLTLTNEFTPTSGAFSTIGADPTADGAVTLGAGDSPQAPTSARTTGGSRSASEPRTVVEKLAELEVDRLDVMAKAVYIDTEKLGRKTFGELAGRGEGSMDAPIASGGVWVNPNAPKPPSAEKRAQWAENYRKSFNLFKTDPLQAFINQGDVDPNITAEEALSSLSGLANVMGDTIKLVQAYKNTGDPRLLDRLRTLAGRWVDSAGHGTQDTIFRNAGLGHLLDQRLFHFPQTDRIAMQGGEQIVQSMLNSPTPTRTQMENAQDFTQHVVKGVENAMSGAMQGGMGQSVNVTVVVQLDRDQIITPEFTEQVSDQMQWNQLEGINRR